MEQNLQQMVDALFGAHLYKIILSNPGKAIPDEGHGVRRYRKIVLNRLDGGWQAEQYTEKQVFHENLGEDGAEAFLLEALSSVFRQCNAWDGQWEFTIRISRGGKASFQKKRTAQAPKEKTGHDRKKRYILEEGTVIPPLTDMGIFTSEGKVVRSMYDKYRQINRFIEIIDDSIKKNDCKHLNIIDFGCGKSYLTFVVYYYLTEIRKISVDIIGLDLKEDVISRCADLAVRYGYEGLHFCKGDIASYQGAENVDMVVTLHACDTATDAALKKAVDWGARVILSVPCCQHELNKTISNDMLAPVLRYGLLKERMAALITDGLRADLLEQLGYRVQVLEFIDMEHTPKNILLRAVRKNELLPARLKEKKREEYLRCIRELSVNPALYRAFFTGE